MGRTGGLEQKQKKKRRKKIKDNALYANLILITNSVGATGTRGFGITRCIDNVCVCVCVFKKVVVVVIIFEIVT